MREHQNEHMENVLGLLLGRDLCSTFVRSVITSCTSVHFVQEVLSISSLHVKVRRLHGFDLNGHTSLGRCSFEHLILAEEASGISWLLLLELWFFCSFGVSSVGVSLQENNKTEEQYHHSHFSIENLSLPSHEFKHIFINSNVLVAGEDIY